MTKLRKFKVGTFVKDRGPNRTPQFEAYIESYNPEMNGCLELELYATSDAEAKKIAKRIARKIYDKCDAAFPGAPVA